MIPNIQIKVSYYNTHTNTHTNMYMWFTWTLHRCNAFATVKNTYYMALDLNPTPNLNVKKPIKYDFLRILNYKDT